ncbi:hypothetical protein B4Q13_18755, partial [Lacticaseibacillus rhamnosus]
MGSFAGSFTGQPVGLALDKNVPVSGTWGSGEGSGWAEQLKASVPEAEVLLRFGKSNGWLDDQPAVITRPYGKGRITYVGGDFFKDAIPPCDLYTMMTVIHDWSDEDSVAILKNVKAKAPRGAKLLLIEAIVDESDIVQSALDGIWGPTFRLYGGQSGLYDANIT